MVIITLNDPYSDLVTGSQQEGGDELGAARAVQRSGSGLTRKWHRRGMGGTRGTSSLSPFFETC